MVRNCVVMLYGLFLAGMLLPHLSLSQWSQDPTQNLQILIGSIEPRMVSDGDGGAIVVATSFTIRPRIFAQRVDKYGNILWDPNLQGIQISNVGDQQALPGSLEKSPQVISDGAGGVYVAFNAYWVVGYYSEPPEEMYTVRTYIQRIDRDGNRRFGQEGIPLLYRAPIDTSFQMLIALVTDGRGGAYVVFEEKRSLKEGKYINRIDSLGTKLWGDGIKLPTFRLDPQVELICYSDGEGGLNIYVLIPETLPRFSDRFLKINSNGEITLDREIEIGVPPFGLSPFYDFVSQNGEAIFVWQDFRSDTIRVQKIDTEGNTLWGQIPIVLDLKWPYSVFFFVTSDQSGGMFVLYPSSEGSKLKHIGSDGNITWERKTGGNGLVFDRFGGLILSIPASGNSLLQRFDFVGTPLWSSGGVVYTTRRPESPPVLISDGTQGAIIAWYEIVPDRGIWMQQVNKEGSLGIVTHVGSSSAIDVPVNFVLHQNYPNPFNTETVITYELNKREEVSLAIYNVVGEEVRRLIRKNQWPGKYQITWDGKNAKGGEVPSGIYYYRLKTLYQTVTKKLLLLR